MNLDIITNHTDVTPTNQPVILEITQYDLECLNGIHGEEMYDLASSYFEAKRRILESQQDDNITEPTSSEVPATTMPMVNTTSTSTTTTTNTITVSSTTTTAAPTIRSIRKRDRVFGCRFCPNTVQYDRFTAAEQHVQDRHPHVTNPASLVLEIGKVIRYTDGTAEVRYTAGDTAGQVVPVVRRARRNVG